MLNNIESEIGDYVVASLMSAKQVKHSREVRVLTGGGLIDCMQRL